MSNKRAKRERRKKRTPVRSGVMRLRQGTQWLPLLTCGLIGLQLFVYISHWWLRKSDAWICVFRLLYSFSTYFFFFFCLFLFCFLHFMFFVFVLSLSPIKSHWLIQEWEQSSNCTYWSMKLEQSIRAFTRYFKGDYLMTSCIILILGIVFVFFFLCNSAAKCK